MGYRSSLVALLLILTGSPSPQPITPEQPGAGTPGLTPTAHAPVPPLERMWLVPDARASRASAASPATARFANGVRTHRAGRHADALPLLAGGGLTGPLADYAAYYTALTRFRLGHPDEARRGFAALRSGTPQGYLMEAIPRAEADIAEARRDFAAAIAIYEELARQKTIAPEEVLNRLARAALESGDERRALEAFHKLYYDFPASDLSEAAGTELPQRRGTGSRELFALDLGRAQRLFGARRYAEARAGFEALRDRASGDDRELIDLRLGECDFYLGRYRNTLDATRPYLDRGARKAEAQFFYLSALRDSGDDDEFIQRTRSLVEAFPESSWAEEALNNLASSYLRANEDAEANAVFQELYRRFPSGPRAERAAWKIGWWAYKKGRPAETVQAFESASMTFPRSDTRPAFLYWSARAHEEQAAPLVAQDRLSVLLADYGSSYYGRLAARRLDGQSLAKHSRGSAVRGRMRSATDATAPAIPAPTTGREGVGDVMSPNEPAIRALLGIGLYEDAMREVLYSQRMWGDTPALQATQAWIAYRQGDLRKAITLMKRAYPQFLTAEQPLPVEIMKVIYPLDYWDTIRRHAAARKLDPYLVAALIGQESTFAPAVRSPANAYGMMQIVPATGRRLARSVGIRRFTTSMLTNPETNIRLGTLYFANLVRQFGGVHFALAAYNAGENRVERWIAERPGVEREEFIDDIPFPETQNYVKRILGTTEDYRRLYGQMGAVPDAGRPEQNDVAPAPATKKAPARKAPTKRKARPR